MKKIKQTTGLTGAHGQDHWLWNVLAWGYDLLTGSPRKTLDRHMRLGQRRSDFYAYIEELTNFNSGKSAAIALGLGMDPAGTDGQGTPIAFRAVALESTESSNWAGTKILLSAAKNFDMADTQGFTVLGLAARMGDYKLPLIQWLLENGADPLHEDRNGRNSLFRVMDWRLSAQSHGDQGIEALKVLMAAAGAKCLETQDRYGRTILDLAENRKDEKARQTIENVKRYQMSSERFQALRDYLPESQRNGNNATTHSILM